MTETHYKSAREQALHVLHRVETTGAYVSHLLADTTGNERDNNHRRDRALLEQLVKGTLDWRGRIDAVLDGVVKGGIGPLTPWIRTILRLGTYQILFLDRIPPEVAVHESVELAKRYGHRGTTGLVNAVLRKVAAQVKAGTTPSPVSAAGQQDEAEGIAATYSHPLWLVRH
jgi:16S rRNA (cytosine967-C5)-methyltransferase